MFLKPSPRVAIRLTPYQHLEKLYESKDQAVQRASLNALPESFRLQILDSICKPAGRPVKAEYEEVRVFDPLPRLQQAVKEVATKAFAFFKQNTIASEICNRHRRPSLKDGNSREDHATDNIPLLLKTMHRSFGDLIPELQEVLNEWAKQGEPEEDRAKAQFRIICFLRKPSKTGLLLNYLNLKSLPGIFDKELLIFRLRKLVLSGNKLESIPKEIGLLWRLKTLDLAQNKLESIPEEIYKLQHLTRLNLSHNFFTSIPNQIGLLSKLTTLDLTGNQLKSIPKKIGLLSNLTALELNGNQLESIPKKIGWIPDLSFLYISNNRLKSIPQEIYELRHLMRLDLSGNKLTSLPHSIDQLRDLAMLNLKDNLQLKSLPRRLFCLPRRCRVHIQRTGLSEEVLSNLQQAYNAREDQAPTIVMEHMLLSKSGFKYVISPPQPEADQPNQP